MSHPAGTRLGPYEILSPIGAGGMGEIYKARDTRLDRIVAVKVLPPSLAQDPEFKARFEREAKSISALNHPNICTLYDVGEADAPAGSYLVMEYLEGETLASRLTKGALPADQALAFALQIADALDKAHRQGIIHRDLKPANVFILKAATASGPGTCKLLDFGLAKLGATVPPGTVETKLVTPTAFQATTPITTQGSILGTFQYMAPEQIEGEEVDARADIWGFGCVLYEMLTGRRAFEGKSQASLIASILERQPAPVAELQPMTPPALGRIVRTCLEKRPEDRFHTAHDLRLQLAWVDEGGSAAGVPAPVIAGRKRHDRTAWAAGALVLAAAAAAAAWILKPAPPVAPGVPARFSHTLGPDLRFTRTGRRTVAISPDGTKIAFIAANQIYVRRLNDTAAQPIRGTNVDPVELAFSPDGEWLAFFVPVQSGGPLEGAALKKVLVTGGTPMALGPTGAPSGLRWQDGTLVFSTGRQILRIPEAGGVAPETLLSAEGSDDRISHPQLLNGGRDLLYTFRPPGTAVNDALIVVQPVSGGERRTLVTGGTDGRVLPSGHLVYVRDATLFVVAFDAARLTLTGSPVPMAEGIRVGTSGPGQFDVSQNGTLVVDAGSREPETTIVWVDRTGRETATDPTPQLYYVPRVSPDGRRIVVTSVGAQERDLWIWEDERKTMTRLTSTPEEEGYPVWSRDGRSLYYRADPTGQFDIYRRAADGTGTPEQLTKTPEAESPLSLLVGGQQLLFRSGADVRSSNSVLGALSLEGDRTIKQVAPAVVRGSAEVSPDGRWLAYESRESGPQSEIWVRPFPDTEGGRWQVSIDGGERPMWSRSSGELFFRSVRGTNKLMSARVKPTPAGAAFSWDIPVPVLDVARYSFLSIARTFDIAPGDDRFVFLKRVDADRAIADGLEVVINWLDDVRARVKAK